MAVISPVAAVTGLLAGHPLEGLDEAGARCVLRGRYAKTRRLNGHQRS